MSATATATPNNATLEQDERVVEEVHCVECGAPISAIPSWYANVNVKFSCDNCRQKSPRLTPALATADNETPSAASGSIDSELDAEPALEDIDVDDIEIELDDADADSDSDSE